MGCREDPMAEGPGALNLEKTGSMGHVTSKSLSICHRTKGADMICGTQGLNYNKSMDRNHNRETLASL